MAGSKNGSRQRTVFVRLTFTLRLPLSSESSLATERRASSSALGWESLSPTNVIRRHLHPALKQLNFVNQFNGAHKAGSHAFRRFRSTYLRNKTECPDGLRNYWMAHAGSSMSDLYDKIKEDVQFRKIWAERCGFGFEFPSVVPNVPKTAEKAEAREAA